MNRAVQEGSELKENYCVLPGLESSIFVFRMRDRTTEGAILVRQRIIGVEKLKEGWRIYKDWELLLLLNCLAEKPRSFASKTYTPSHPSAEDFAGAKQFVMDSMDNLHVPFHVPYLEQIACLCSPASD